MSSTFTYTADQGQPVPDASEMRFGVVVTEWNNDITDKLLDGTLEELSAQGVPLKNVTVKRVPGSFELVYAAAQLAKFGHVNGIIILGCVIKGDTPHFDYICQGVTYGIARLNTISEIPIIYGLLTTDDLQQAKDRSGGKYGNKGDECAVDAIKMAKF